MNNMFWINREHRHEEFDIDFNSMKDSSNIVAYAKAVLQTNK